MSQLLQGEQLQTLIGPMSIDRIEVCNQPVPVYNIEVFGEHVYQVTELGILVHNARPCIQELDVRPYGHFRDNINIGDGLTGHELLQSAWIRRNHGHSRSSPVGGRNPAIALFEDLPNQVSHKFISDLQKDARFDYGSQSARRNALANVGFLLQADLSREKAAELLIATRRFILEQGW